MLFIEAVNLTKEKIDTQIIIGFTKKIIKKLRQKKGFPFLKNIDLSIAFIGEAEIKKLNSKYRKINKPTDELSFLLEKSRTKLSGEILLCPKVIKTKDYGFHNPNYKLKAISYKLRGLLAHAFLHLCGFDHKTKKEWKKMEEMEEMERLSLRAKRSNP